MGQILIENGRSWFGNKIVTLTRVYVTSDLGLARFYLSLGSFEEPQAMIKDIHISLSVPNPNKLSEVNLFMGGGGIWPQLL